ncbi:uncharacterized protein LOC144715313 [Wolffia australiana]
MKGRSNRLPVPSAASEDWGDGSWTVDCSCGVTFDDGEEMVNCDLCGVWVHTRCSRYVKGEASFACDKCKGKKRHHTPLNGSGSEINGNHCGFNGGFVGITNTEETEVAQLLAELPTKADHRPFKLWTRAPIEDRVHIHGIPGGDPALFRGISSVFSSELWKCTGYVAKKFNFKYKEFPCWEEEEENPTNRGADLLFSLSKDVFPRCPLESSFGFAEIQKTVRKDGKIPGSGAVIGGRSQFYAKKERSKIRDGGVNSGKRKEPTGGRDQSGKKKSRSSVDCKKKGSLSRDDSRKANISEEDLLKAASLGLENLKSEIRKEVMPSESRSSNRYQDNGHNNPMPKVEIAAKIRESNLANETPVKIETCDQYGSQKTEISPTVGSPIVRPCKPCESFKENVEDLSSVAPGKRTSNVDCNNMGDMDETSSSSSLKSEKQTASNVDIRGCSSAVINATLKYSTSIAEKSSRIKIEEDLTPQDTPDEKLDRPDLSPSTLTETASVCSRLNSKIDEATKVLAPIDVKQLAIDSTERCMKDKLKPEVWVSTKDGPSAPNLTMKQEERVKPVFTSSASSASTEPKVVPSAAKLSLPSPNQSSSKSPCSTASPTFEKAILKEKMKIKTSTGSISADELAKGLTKSLSKSSQPVPKQGEVPRNESSHSKSAVSDSGRKNEKLTLPIPHLSSGQSSNPAALNPPSVNTSSALSDEELARLLHQELNSSPRVPRIPRLRQPEKLHLASSGTASLLSKSSGGKDQAQASRRKNREDSFRDRSRSSYGLGGETRKGDRLSSPDTRKEDHLSNLKRGGQLVHNGVSSSSKKTAVQVVSVVAKVDEQTVSSTGGGSWPSKASSPADLAAAQYPTLPGLIDEIMGKGNCATYKELCNAVLPHWKNLRKPNGDKYAYSSHSQAVLDCLRNRSQWAHLIDRGPKTNSSRKRRKAGEDTDPSQSDSGSEDLDDADDDEKDEGNSPPDEFPKGRRNARKRRRLVLRGRVLRTRPSNRADLRSSASSSSDDGDGDGDGDSRSFSSGDIRHRSASNSTTSLDFD